MSIKVVFVDGSVVEYPEGAGVSESADMTLKFVNDAGAQVIATLPAAEVKSTETV